MSGFAASYSREANEAWLNDLIADIVNPSSRSRYRSQSRDHDDDFADTSSVQLERQREAFAQIASEYSATTTQESLSSRSPQVPFRTSSAWNSHSCARTPIRPSAISPGSGVSNRSPTVVETPEDVRHGSSVSEPRQSHDVDGHTSFCTPPQRAHRESWRTIDSDRTFSPPDLWSPNSVTLKTTACPSISTESPQPSTHAQKQHKMKTSLGRTKSQQMMTLEQNQSARSPSVTESTCSDKSTNFKAHPSVRPLEKRPAIALSDATGTTNEDSGHEYPKRFALTLIVIGICLSVFIVSVDRNVITTAIPKITEEFHSYDDIGWYGSAYFITASAFQPLYGRVYMSFDTRWTFLAALFIFELGSVLGGASPNSIILILGRAVQGIGSAGILTGSFVVATHSVRLQFRPVLFAFVGILYGTGALAGPLLGGVFTDLVSWRWVFWINLPIGAITFTGVFFFFKPQRTVVPTSRRPWVDRILCLDLIGNIIFLGAAMQLFVALQKSETYGDWSNPQVVGLLCGCGATFSIFIVWMFYKGDAALIPPRIIKQRTVAASCGAAFFIYGAIGIHAYYLPIWFQAIRGDSAVEAGVNMIPYMLANALFSLIAGIFVSKNGLFAPPAIIGCAIGTVGSGLLTTLNQHSPASRYIGFEILISVGIGMAIQQGFSAVQTALPLEEVPIGTAAVVASQSLGGAIFVSVGNSILQSVLLNPKNTARLPGVNLREVLRQGATMFRGFVPAEVLPDLLELYNNSLQKVFAAVIPLCGLAFVCSLAMEWRSVKNKQDLKRKSTEVSPPRRSKSETEV